MNTVSKRTNTCGRKSEHIHKDKIEKFYNDNIFKLMKKENIINDNKLSFILHYEAIDMITNIENNIREHFIDHVKKLIKIKFNFYEKLKLILKLFTNEDIINSKTKLFDEFNLIVEDVFNVETNKFNSSQKWHEMIKNIKKNIVTKTNYSKNSIFYDVKSNPQDYLKHMIYLNKEFEKLSTDENSIRLISVTPLRNSLIPCNITLDTACLISIMYENGNSQMFKNINKIKNEVWNEHFTLLKDYYFKSKKKEVFKSIFRKKSYQFNYMIKTDGVSCSLLFIKLDNQNKPKKISSAALKKISENNDAFDKTYIEKQANMQEIIGEDMNYVCVDPNYDDIIYCLDKNGKKFRYTRVQRNKEIESISNVEQKEELTNNTKIGEKSIKEFESNLAKYNSKTCNFRKFLEFVEEKNKAQLALKTHYENKIYRKHRLNRYSNKLRSESKMVKNFKKTYGNPNKTAIIFGDYDCGGNYVKKKEPLVTRRLRKVLRNACYKVYLINEHNTSKKCHKCESNNETFMKRKITDEKTKKTKEVNVWGLLRCQNLECTVRTRKTEIVCRSIYNRDYNSCKNMLKIVRSLLETGKRPEIFCMKTN